MATRREENKMIDDKTFRIDLLNYSHGKVTGKKSLLKPFCTFKKQGAHFSKLYKEKKWDGTVSIIKYNRLPLGLLPYFVGNATKRGLNLEFFLNLKPITPKELHDGIFKGPGANVEIFLQMLSLLPENVVSRYYQLDSLESILQSSRGIIVLPTGSGKSLSIYMLMYMLRSFLNTGLILVPRAALVDQLAQDFKLFSGNTVHTLTSTDHGRDLLELIEEKDNVIISTWQSWSSWIEDGINIQPDYVIVDEAHTLASKNLITEYSIAVSDTRFRYGLTATENEPIYDRLALEGLLGPVLYKELPEKLIEQGFLARPVIHRLFLEHNVDTPTSKVTTRDLVRSGTRMRALSNIIDKELPQNESLLILTEAVTEELIPFADVLTMNLVDSDILTLTRISHRTERNRIIELMNQPKKRTILIVTYGLFQMGINIPNLKYIMLFSPSKSHIRVLQTIGRALRPKDFCLVWDVIDYCDEKLDTMSSKRLAIYNGAYGEQLTIQDRHINL